MMRTSLATALLAGAILALPLKAGASPITYTLNDAVGSGGITGTITTNGAIGTLSESDLTAWNVIVSDGTNAFDLTGTNSTLSVGGADLSASTTQLLFDFGDVAGGYLFMQSPQIGENGPYACFISNFPGCFETSAIVLNSTFGTDGPGNPYAAMTGDQVIGSAIPEPGTVLLLGMGLAGFLAIGRRHPARCG